MALNMDDHIVNLYLLWISNPLEVSTLLDWKLVEFEPILLANVVIQE